MGNLGCELLRTWGTVSLVLRANPKHEDEGGVATILDSAGLAVKDESSCTLRAAIAGSRGNGLGGKLPSFFFHFAVGPVLQLFEQGRFDHGKADADPAFFAHPHQPGLGLEHNFAVRQNEANVEQSSES